MADDDQRFRSQLADYRASIETALKNSVNKAAMRQLGEIAIALITQRTQGGYGVNAPFGSKQKLKALSSRYIEQRRRDKSLSFNTSPSKSNLTRTGKMLASMRVLQEKDGSISIGPSFNNRGGGKTNADIAQYQEQLGRKFNYLSAQEFRAMIDIHKRIVAENVKNRR